MAHKSHNLGDVEYEVRNNCVKLGQRAGGSSLDRIFKCKTCQQGFGSFQALGGHVASHKRPKIVSGDGDNDGRMENLGKPYRCNVCGQGFRTGQALGGHKRKRRTAKIECSPSHQQSSTVTGESDQVTVNRAEPRILGIDLNMSPEENELLLG